MKNLNQIRCIFCRVWQNSIVAAIIYWIVVVSFAVLQSLTTREVCAICRHRAFVHIPRIIYTVSLKDTKGWQVNSKGFSDGSCSHGPAGIPYTYRSISSINIFVIDLSTVSEFTKYKFSYVLPKPPPLSDSQYHRFSLFNSKPPNTIASPLQF